MTPTKGRTRPRLGCHSRLSHRRYGCRGRLSACLSLLLHFAGVAISASAKPWKIIRVPKAGSTAILDIFHDKFPAEAKSCGVQVSPLRHQGCWPFTHSTRYPLLHPQCDGPSQDALPAVAVLRHPSERFFSQHRHMFLVARPHAVAHWKTPELLAHWLRNISSGCNARTNDTCVVEQIQLSMGSLRILSHGVILWPQSFFIPPRAAVLCYHPTHLIARLMKLAAFQRCNGIVAAVNKSHQSLGDHLKAPVPRSTGAPNQTEIMAVLRELYPNDFFMWEAMCG